MALMLDARRSRRQATHVRGGEEMRTGRSIVFAVGVFLVASLVLATNTGQSAAQPKEPIPYQVGTSRLQFLPSPPPGKVTMKFEFWWRNGYALPAPIRFFRPVGEANKVWAMESLERGQAVPKGEEYKDGIVFVTPGEFVLLEAVFENPLDKAIEFLVTAPIYDPIGGQRLTTLRCLCAAIPFGALPGGAWYRTMPVGVNKTVKAGTKIIVMWPAVRLK